MIMISLRSTIWCVTNWRPNICKFHVCVCVCVYGCVRIYDTHTGHVGFWEILCHSSAIGAIGNLKESRRISDWKGQLTGTDQNVKECEKPSLTTRCYRWKLKILQASETGQEMPKNARGDLSGTNNTLTNLIDIKERSSNRYQRPSSTCWRQQQGQWPIPNSFSLSIQY